MLPEAVLWRDSFLGHVGSRHVNCSLKPSHLSLILTVAEKVVLSLMLAFLRSIGFRADHVHSGAVRVLACSLAGWTKANEAPVLQSLQCELMFNDMRDAERRHKKADFTKASNVCCAGIRSSWNRSPAESVHLNNLDWVEDEGFKALRAQVLNASRQNDKQLGISLQSLISDRNCSHLTKPHVFCERLRLYRSLLAFFAKKTCNQQEVQRRVDDAWPSALLGPGCVWLFDNKWFLILKTSQYFVRCLELKMKEASPEAKLFVFESCNVWDSMDVRLEGQSFGLACPCVLEAAKTAVNRLTKCSELVNISVMLCSRNSRTADWPCK